MENVSASDNLDPLIAALTPAEDESVAFGTVIEALLKWGAANHEATIESFRTPALRTRRNELRRRAPLPPATPFFSSDEAGALRRWLVDNARESTLRERALVVRSLAKAFDVAAWADQYVGWISRSPRRLLGPGDVFPRLSPFDALKRMYGGQLGTRAGALADDSELELFGVLPDPMPSNLRIALNPNWHALDAIDESTVVGVASPWCFEDLDIQESDSSAQTFFRVVPKGADANSRPLDSTRALMARDTHVLLLPEVVANAETAHEIADLMAAHRSLVVGVNGSAHDVVAGVRANVATVVARGGLRGSQHKIVGMTFNDTLEDIQVPDPVLEVFLGQNWSVVVLICRDFIDEEIGALTRRLRPGLVLVPSCSPKTADFANRVADLTSTQTHVVVVNTSRPPDHPKGDPDVALVLHGRPIKSTIEQRVRQTLRRGSALPFQQEFSLHGA